MVFPPFRYRDADVAGEMDGDKFALFVFEDGLAVEPVTFIDSFDPATHNSATWPRYKDASQKKNWVRVNWPNADRFGKATGTTTSHAAQVVRFGGTYLSCHRYGISLP